MAFRDQQELWTTAEDLGRVFQSMIDAGNFTALKRRTFEFMFKQSLKSSRGLREELKGAGALLEYDEEGDEFTTPWTLETVAESLRRIRSAATIGSAEAASGKTHATTSAGKSVHAIRNPICDGVTATTRQRWPLSPTGSNSQQNEPKVMNSGHPTGTGQTEFKVSPPSDCQAKTQAPVPVPAPRHRVRPIAKLFDLKPTQRTKPAEIDGADDNTANRPIPQPRVLDLFSSATDYTNKGSIVEDALPIVTSRKYIMVGQLLEEHRSAPAESPQGALSFYRWMVPLAMQKIRMWGVHCMGPRQLNEYFNKFHGKLATGVPQFGQLSRIQQLGPRTPNPDNKGTLSTGCCRLYLLSLLIAAAEDGVVADMFRVLAQFHQLALPLVIPACPTGTGDCKPPSLVQLLPILSQCKVQWNIAGCDPQQSYLLSDPFTLIVAVRFGSAPRMGKSTVLNCLFQEPNMFTTKVSSSLAGSVELVWMTEETCAPSMWSRIVSWRASQALAQRQRLVLLANVHGHALDHPDTLLFLSNISSRFIVFYMPEVQSTIDTHRAKLQAQLGNDRAMFGELLVDPGEDVKALYDQSTIVETATLVDPEGTLQKLGNLILGALSVSVEPPTAQQLNIGIYGRIQPRPSKAHLEAFENPVNKLLAHVTRVGVLAFRASLRLQSSAEIDTVKALEHLDTNREYRHGVTGFAALLQLSPSETRRAAYTLLDIALGKESVSAQTDCLRAREKLSKQKLALASGGVGREDLKQLRSVQADIDETFSAYHARNLGVEHFVRETARLFELSLQFRDDVRLTPFRDAPFFAAQLLLDGVAFELLDGDLNEMSSVWLEAMFHSVCIMQPGLRVFVISILGLQSSGKSTLLNALFGAQFAVSAGRCTRGLFLRLMHLEPKLAAQYGIDAVLLIDTEGLGSPELMNKNYPERDRLMATFAMCISNLTLVNVRGSLNEMAGILEIVVVTLARLEKANISPDILLVQHLSQRSGVGLTAEGVNEFQKSLESALQLIDNKDMELGIKNSENVARLKRSIQSGGILVPFGSFKSGASDFAAPSKHYHEDVRRLYNKILDRMAHEGGGCSAVNFHTWHSNLYSYWAAVKSDDFARRFHNIREMSDFLENFELCGQVKQLLDSAFKGHHAALVQFIDGNIHALGKFPGNAEYAKQRDEVVEATIRDHLEVVPRSCDTAEGRAACKRCLKAVEKMEILLQRGNSEPSAGVFQRSSHLEQDIESYLLTIRASEFKSLMDVWVTKKLVQNEGSLFNSHIEEVLREEPNPTHANLEQLAEKVLTRTESAIREHYKAPPPLVQRLKKDFAEVYPEAGAIEKARIYTTLESSGGGSHEGAASAKLERMKWAIEAADAFSVGFKRTITTLLRKKSSVQRLQPDEMEFIDRKFHQLPATITSSLSQRRESGLAHKENGTDGGAGVGRYETGMMHQLKASIAEVLGRVEKKAGKLLPEFKWRLIEYALKIFAVYMERIETEWNQKNQPLTVLKLRKEAFVKQLSYRLLPENAIEKQGLRLGRSLLAALKTHVAVHLDKKYGRTILGTLAKTGNSSWILSAELTRLKFFSGLAEEVNAGSYKKALAHFERPQSTFMEWYRQEVNAILMNEQRQLRDASSSSSGEYELFRTGLFNMLQLVKESSSLSVVDFESQLRTLCGEGLEIDLSVVRDTAELRSLYKIVEKTCWEGQEHAYEDMVGSRVCRQEAPDYMGCTASCRWCGAICWGLKGHEKGFGMTIKHHTCHQPRGLAGTVDMSTEELVPTSCDQGLGRRGRQHSVRGAGCSGGADQEELTLGKKDGDYYIFFDEDDKELDYWIYKQHPKRQFQELLQWMYVKLLGRLAEKYEAKPTTKKGLDEAGFAGVGRKDLNTVLAMIQTQLQYS